MAVTITCTFPQIGTTLVRVQAADGTWTTLESLYRADAWGNNYRVRGGSEVALAGGVIVVPDEETPLDTDVTYTAVVRKGSSKQTGTVTVHPPTDRPDRTFLSLADSPGSVVTPHMESIPEIVRETNVGIYEVLGRVNPVVATGTMGSRKGTMTLLTATQDETDHLWSLADKGDVLLFRTTREYGVGILYFVILEITENRITRLGMFAQRRFTVEFVETDPPVGAASSAAWNTWQRVLDAQTTWQGVINTRATWELVLTDPYGVTPPPTLLEAGHA
jgi:hypothetical protein